MMMGLNCSRNAILASLWLGLAGCASYTTEPSRFYALIPAVVAAPLQPLPKLMLGVGPVHLPTYLDRQQMVTRVQATQLEVNEFERWGGSLEQNIRDVLAENLSRLLASDGVITYPWMRRMPVAYQVTLDVRQFEQDPGGRVQLVVQWQLFEGDAERLLEVHRGHYSVPVDPQNYAALAAAQSQALEALSRDIARELIEQSGRTIP